MSLDCAKQVLKAAASIQEVAVAIGLAQPVAVHKAVDSFVAKPVIEMDDDDIRFTQELLTSWKKRFRLLKKKEASYGLDCPPQIQIEIADIEKTVEELERKLKAIKAT